MIPPTIKNIISLADLTVNAESKSLEESGSKKTIINSYLSSLAGERLRISAVIITVESLYNADYDFFFRIKSVISSLR